MYVYVGAYYQLDLIIYLLVLDLLRPDALGPAFLKTFRGSGTMFLPRTTCCCLEIYDLGLFQSSRKQQNIKNIEKYITSFSHYSIVEGGPVLLQFYYFQA